LGNGSSDSFIWAVPNAGNPQKVQRYAIEWASALREMAALEPEILLPGHGIPILGGARVREALLDTAECLESLYRQTVERMNEGATIYEIVESVQMPTELREKPYLRPVYDEPEFIVRNIYRCLGGWYSGIPSELKPAPRSAQAREIADLAGGVEKLLARARVYAQKGDLRMASHLVDWALEADPDSAEVHQVRAKVYQQRIELAPSTMSKGIYAAAVRQSETRGKADPLSQS
jgi:alkyl sulfatase BDS1-like metallo-beta-lactamase superfamily hydrolase